MIKIAKLTPRLMKKHLDNDPRQMLKLRLFHLCTPAPLAGVRLYLLIYALIDYIEIEILPEEETWDSEAGAIQSAQGRVQLGDD